MIQLFLIARKARKMDIYLYYTGKGKKAWENKVKELGLERKWACVALDDFGESVEFTGWTPLKIVVDKLKETNSTAKVTKVSQLREVQDWQGNPVNQDKWPEWNYTHKG